MNNTQYIIIYHRPTRCGFTLCLWDRMELLKLTGRQIFCLFKLLQFSWVRKHDKSMKLQGEWLSSAAGNWRGNRFPLHWQKCIANNFQMTQVIPYVSVPTEQKKVCKKFGLSFLKEQENSKPLKTVCIQKNTQVLRITDILRSKCSRKILENWLKTRMCPEHYNHWLLTCRQLQP